jgi:hypothetical protein
VTNLRLGAKPLSRRVALFFSGKAIFSCFLGLFFFVPGCVGDDSQSGTGKGITGDVGEACTVFCYSAWCKDDDQIECRSTFCVGQVDQTYCTVICDLDAQCPDGYLCTYGCETKVAKEPVCVKIKDYQFLQELGYCPAD